MLNSDTHCENPCCALLPTDLGHGCNSRFQSPNVDSWGHRVGDTELGSQKLPSPQPRSQTLWGRGGLALYSPEDPVALTTVALPRCEVVSGLEDEMVAPLAPVSVTLSGKRVFTAVTNLKVFR